MVDGAYRVPARALKVRLMGGDHRLGKAKATKHSVVIRSVHNARVPMPAAAKKEALKLIRSTRGR